MRTHAGTNCHLPERDAPARPVVLWRRSDVDKDEPDKLLHPFYAAKEPDAESIAGKIIERVRRTIRAHLEARGVRDGDLDDLCETACIRLLQQLRASRAPDEPHIGNVVAYAKRIAYNLFVDRYRKIARDDEVLFGTPEKMEELLAQSSGGAPPDHVAGQVVSRCWLQETLWPLVGGLRPLHRAVLLLHVEIDELCLLTGKRAEGEARAEVARALLPSPEETDQLRRSGNDDVGRALVLLIRKLPGLWGDLPLRDAQIAGILGIAAADVPNLRRSARNTLERRSGFSARTRE